MPTPAGSPSDALLAGRPWPRIIQGGMGIAVSGWRLARAVASLGELGVVSGTGIDTAVVRELQLGDPHGRREALAGYPDRRTVAELFERYYVEGGIGADEAFNLLPMHGFDDPTPGSQRLLAAATYSEVVLAKRGHDGRVGINLMSKLKRHVLGGLYGAVLAGADAVLMGAGVPIEEAVALDRLAKGEAARLTLEVHGGDDGGGGTCTYELDPAAIVRSPGRMPRPAFIPIIGTDMLASILMRRLPAGLISAWVVEGPTAGGHNAPPREKRYDAAGRPVYGKRDEADLEKMRRLGLPFYLAGGRATPERLREAEAAGAAGVQVGTLFSLADESGYPADLKAEIIARSHRGELSVRTDGRGSPTGFPFKVVSGASDAVAGEGCGDQRRRVCDLGYLQTAYVDAAGRVRGRCAAGPVEQYVQRGGDAAETVGRACLCNGLLANIGLGQRQPWGNEPTLLTAGEGLTDLPLGSAEVPRFTVAEVVAYLRGA